MSFHPDAASTRIGQEIDAICTCLNDGEDYEKNFCYSEGTPEDQANSNSILEMTENTWYGIKPPRLFTKEFFPLITARQIYITRILMDGKRTMAQGDEDSDKKEKVTVSITKKKSAVRFLSQVHIE